MKPICKIFFIFVLIVSCNNNTYKDASVFDFIPQKSSIIITINDVESVKTNLNNNDFIKGISKTSVYKNVTKKLTHLKYFKTTNPVLISFLKDKNDSLQFTINTKQVEGLFVVDSLPNHKIESITIANQLAKKITYNNQVLYITFKDSIAIGASNTKLLASVLNKKNKNEPLKKIINTNSKDKSISVVLNNNNTNITTIFNSEVLLFKNFTSYTSLDTEISQDEIIFNGITKASDSTLKLINVFKNTIPQENEMAKIAPNNCDGFLSFTFNDFKKFKKNLDNFNKKQDTLTNGLFDSIIEVGTIYSGENNAIVLNSIDVIATKDNLLGEHNKIENFRQVDLYSFSNPDIFDRVFYPLINYNKIKYYCNIDQFFVFANNIETLENIIANYQNKTTLSSRDYYKNAIENLSNEASILHVLNNEKLKDLIDLNLDTHLENNFKNYKVSALQFVYDTHYAHFNGVIKKNKIKAEENAITELLNIKLDTDLLNSPQFVINHRSKQKEIVVQDINNKLYLISNTGNILWKKQLNGPILGKIEQLDIYKNGRLQLVFATPNRVYLIDRTGKNVTGYPLKFNDKITQPLSVFDYDKRKNYRLFVTQGKNVLLYDAKGKTIKGFKFSKTKDNINSQPQHIRIGSKDYILVKTNSKLNILNRRGQIRIKVKSKQNYSNQAVYKYNNTFTTTTVDGNIISIDQKGGISIKDEGLTTRHNITTTSKTLVSQNENILNIRSNKIELDLGNYTSPKIFYLKDKIYVSVTDLQSQKVLLFDSQAKPIENFPVYGTSSIELDNIDRDKALEFVTKGENNSILLYEIN